ncbi:MAG: oxygenase MpaB family protein [Tsuneonella sp.]
MNEMSRVARTMPPIDFSRPKGEEAYLAPDSIQWKVFKNPIALGVGGVAAVLLEFADARIRSGVWDHSIYKVDPIGRSQRTGMAAMVGVYGPKSVARQVIGGVNRMHTKVVGKTPAGEDYRALDPELLNWVSATAQYGFVAAYDRFVRRLSAAEKDRFWTEGSAVAELYGVTEIPRSEADFMNMMARLRPRFEPHPINREFLGIIRSGRAAPSVPRFLHRALARAAVSILPPVVRSRLELGREFELSASDRVLVSLMGRLAERVKDRTSPAWQAAERLGLPGDMAWRR